EGNDTASDVSSPGGVGVSLKTGGGKGNDAADDVLVLGTIENLTGSGFADLLIGDDKEMFFSGCRATTHWRARMATTPWMVAMPTTRWGARSAPTHSRVGQATTSSIISSPTAP